MSLREKMDQQSGKRTYTTLKHPVLGDVKIRSLTEREWQIGFATWFQDSDGKRITERAIYGNVKLVQMCLVDPETDSLVYTDSFADLNSLVDQREEVTKPLFDAAWEFNRPELAKNALSPSDTTTS